MKSLSLQRLVEAPPERVFALATDLERAHTRIQSVRSIELLTEGPVGIGTRYRETRLLLERENTEDMEITGFDPPRSFELGAEAMGCRYRTVFTFDPEGAGTQVGFLFEAHPLTMPARMMLSAMGGMLKQLEAECARDLEDLKRAAEA